MIFPALEVLASCSISTAPVPSLGNAGCWRSRPCFNEGARGVHFDACAVAFATCLTQVTLQRKSKGSLAVT